AVMRIHGVDGLGNIARRCQGVARGDRLDLGAALGREQSGGDQIIWAAQGLAGWSHGGVLVTLAPIGGGRARSDLFADAESPRNAGWPPQAWVHTAGFAILIPCPRRAAGLRKRNIRGWDAAANCGRKAK